MGKKNKKTLALLDAHAIIHRAYHALPDFSSSNTSEPTGALYGLVSMLLKAARDIEPDYMVAAYDLPEPTERHKAFDEYKAGREKPDEELEVQIERSRDIFEAFNIPVYEKKGFEADDIIGSIVDQVKDKKDIEVIIVSGDMDTLQLVDGKRVRVYTLRKGIKDTIVYDEKAVKERFEFGPELLPDYKGLRGDPSDNIPGIKGVGEKTATTLITECGDMDAIYKKVSDDPDGLTELDGISPRIVGLLEEHEEEARFSKMLGEIRHDAPISFAVPKEEWKSSVDVEKVLSLFRELGFRTLSNRAKKFFEYEEEGELFEKQREEDISDEEIRKVGIALWVLRSEHTNPTKDEILRFAGTTAFSKARDYIFKKLKEEELWSVYEDIELPLVPIVKKMQEHGIKIDREYLKNLSNEYHKKLDKVSEKIYEHAGGEFNINSPRQLAEVLFDKLELSPKAKTATGKRSTRESELKKLKGEHPIIEDVLEYRELQKLLSTYIDNVPSMISPQDDRLHAEFIQHGTTTGRMSSQNPNLQNIPIRTDLGKKIRNAFVASDGFKLVACDYSQIELRLAAIMAGDEKMMRVFKEGGDIHTAVAEEVFGSSDADARRKAKVINFGILYGMGVNALARATDATQKEAKAFLDDYFDSYNELNDYIEETKGEARKKGYTETLFGRRRHFPGIDSHLPYVKAEAERMAVNAPLQGTAADIIKIAMADIDEEFGGGDNVRMLLQVHDELVFEIKEDMVEKVAPKIKNIMESALPDEKRNGVPIVVDVLFGDNWGELELFEKK